MTTTINTNGMNETGLLSLKEFMKLCGADRFALHYWDEIGLLLPARRNVPNGHRFYSPDQIAAVHLIQALSSLGIPLNSMKDLGKNREQMHALFRDCDRRLGEKITDLQTKQEQMRSYAAQFEGSRAGPACGIEVRELPEQTMRCVPLKERYAGPAMQSGKNSSPAGYAYTAFYDLLEEPDRPARLVTFDPQGSELRPSGEYLVCSAHCAFGETGSLPRRMLEHAMNTGLEITGPAYVFYLHDALQVTVGINRIKA